MKVIRKRFNDGLYNECQKVVRSKNQQNDSMNSDFCSVKKFIENGSSSC